MRRSILLALTVAALATAPAAWADPGHGDQDWHGDHDDRDHGDHGRHGDQEDRDHDHGRHDDHDDRDHGDRGWHGEGRGRWSPEAEAHFDRHRDPDRWRETRHDWHGAHGDWDRRAAWRMDRDWWRGRSEFRLYAGTRVGFFFVPGVGYHRVPPQYWGHHWGYGEYLPPFFFQYKVGNWQAYDLPPPPPGCAWVWIDGGVALVDLSDGYIMEVERGLW